MTAVAPTAASVTDLSTSVDTSNVIMQIDDNKIATLTGTVDKYMGSIELECEALKLDNVDEVRNFLSY